MVRRRAFQVLEGQVVMQNPQGRLVLDAGEALLGQAPIRSASWRR